MVGSSCPNVLLRMLVPALMVICHPFHQCKNRDSIVLARLSSFISSPLSVGILTFEKEQSSGRRMHPEKKMPPALLWGSSLYQVGDYKTRESISMLLWFLQAHVTMSVRMSRLSITCLHSKLITPKTEIEMHRKNKSLEKSL